MLDGPTFEVDGGGFAIFQEDAGKCTISHLMCGLLSAPS